MSSTDQRAVRRFGIVAGIFFGLLCMLGVWKAKALPTYLFGFLAFLGLAFIVMPGPMGPVHSAWVKTAHLVGRILTAIMLVVAYYGVITPSALIKRLFGGVPLPLRPDRKVTTYWVARNEPAQPRERFPKRY